MNGIEKYELRTNEELCTMWKDADIIIETTITQLKDLGMEEATTQDMIRTFSRDYPASVKRNLYRYVPAFEYHGMTVKDAESYLNIISENCRIRVDTWETLFTKNRTFFISMIRKIEAPGFNASSDVIHSSLDNLAADFPHLLRLYDPSRGTAFCTYIGSAIRQPYRAAVRELGPGNPVTVHEENQLVKYRKAVAGLEAEGKPYDKLAICQKAGFGMKALNNILRLEDQRSKTGHYQGVMFQKDQTRKDLEPSSGISIEEDYMKKEQTELVRKALQGAMKRVNIPLPVETVMQLMNGDISLAEGSRRSGLSNYRLQDMLNSIFEILKNNRVMRDLADANTAANVNARDSLEEAVESIQLEFVSDINLVQQYMEDVSTAIACELMQETGVNAEAEDIIF